MFGAGYPVPEILATFDDASDKLEEAAEHIITHGDKENYSGVSKV